MITGMAKRALDRVRDCVVNCDASPSGTFAPDAPARTRPHPSAPARTRSHPFAPVRTRPHPGDTFTCRGHLDDEFEPRFPLN